MISSFVVASFLLLISTLPTTDSFVISTPSHYSRQTNLGLVQRQQRPGDRGGSSEPRYSDFLYPTDPSERKTNDAGFSTALPVSASSMGSNPAQQQQPPQQQQQRDSASTSNTSPPSTDYYDVYENEDLSVDELRDQVERLLIEEEEAERAEREKLLKMRAQLLERKRKREQDGLER